jgi:hypothetical protein
VATYDVARSINGGSYQTIATGLAGASLDVTLTPGKNYRFRVRAHDKAGNVGAWATGPTLHPKLVQQTGSGVSWRKAWSSDSATAFSAGSVRRSTTAGATAAYRFSGRSVGFVTTYGPDRGSVKVYIDGKYVTTVNLSAGGPAERVVVYSRKWKSFGTHTIKLVVVGSSGHPRVDVDAFAVLG